MNVENASAFCARCVIFTQSQIKIPWKKEFWRHDQCAYFLLPQLLTLHPNNDQSITKSEDFDLMAASNENWSRIATKDFWSAISPSDHVVQIYNDDRTFLNLLEGFVTSGFSANDCVIVIATDEHQHALEERLRAKGHNVFELKLQDQFLQHLPGNREFWYCPLLN